MSDAGAKKYDDDRLYIPVSKLPELLEGPKLSVFYRQDRNSGSREIGKIPLEAAIQFCSIIKAAYSNNKDKYYTINGGFEKAHKDVLKWIVDCCKSPDGTKHQFRNVDDPDDGFFYYPQVMLSGKMLGIKGFAEGLHKRMMGVARKNLIKEDEVYMYYGKEPAFLFPAELKLKEIAHESIVFARADQRKGRWIDGNHVELQWMMADIPGLEENLAKRQKEKDIEREEYLANKRREEAAAAAGGGGAGASWNESDNTAGAETAVVGDGWHQDASNDFIAGKEDWDAKPKDAVSPTATGETWDSDATTHAGGTSWDEQVQEEQENKAKW